MITGEAVWKTNIVLVSQFQKFWMFVCSGCRDYLVLLVLTVSSVCILWWSLGWLYNFVVLFSAIIQNTALKPSSLSQNLKKFHKADDDFSLITELFRIISSLFPHHQQQCLSDLTSERHFQRKVGKKPLYSTSWAANSRQTQSESSWWT